MIAALLGWVWSTPIIRKMIVTAAIFGGLFVWHVTDRASAVQAARAGLVAEAELTSARVQLEEYRRRQAVADSALRYLNAEIERANAESEAAAEELEHYETTVGDFCVVQPGLFKRLRQQ